MVKISEINEIEKGLHRVEKVINLIKKIVASGATIKTKHPITEEEVTLVIPVDAEQKAMNKLQQLKDNLVNKFQAIDWTKVE